MTCEETKQCAWHETCENAENYQGCMCFITPEELKENQANEDYYMSIAEIFCERCLVQNCETCILSQDFMREVLHDILENGYKDYHEEV